MPVETCCLLVDEVLGRDLIVQWSQVLFLELPDRQAHLFVFFLFVLLFFVGHYGLHLSLLLFICLRKRQPKSIHCLAD